jgi:hypothetical protein
MESRSARCALSVTFYVFEKFLPVLQFMRLCSTSLMYLSTASREIFGSDTITPPSDDRLQDDSQRDRRKTTTLRSSIRCRASY